MLVAAYRRKLLHYPHDAVSYLTDQALELCKWFPTINECLEIIGRWRRRDENTENRKLAQHIVRAEMNRRMDETFAALESQTLTPAQIEAMPEYWRNIAEERCLLWPDGSYRVAA